MGEPLKMEEYKEWQAENPWAPFYKTISERWGWSTACDAAGVEPFEYTPHREWPVAARRQALRDAHADLGDSFAADTYREWASGRDAPAINVLYRHYDSFYDACQDAGIDIEREMVDACPECDSVDINRRSTKTPEWRCYACSSEFDEPNERESHQ